MAILARRLSGDSVAGHIEVERQDKRRQSWRIRSRSRKLVSDAGWSLHREARGIWWNFGQPMTRQLGSKHGNCG